METIQEPEWLLQGEGGRSAQTEAQSVTGQPREQGQDKSRAVLGRSGLAPHVSTSQMKGQAVPWCSQETSQRSQRGSVVPCAQGGRAEMRVRVTLLAVGLLSGPVPPPGHTQACRPWPRCPGTCISCIGSTSSAAHKNSTSCLLCRWQGSPWHMSIPEIPGECCVRLWGRK